MGGFCQQILKLGNHPAPLIKFFLEKHLQMNAYTVCLQLKFYSKLVLDALLLRSWCGEIIQSSKGRFWYVKSTTSKGPVVPAKTRRVKNHHHHHHDADDLSFELHSSNTVSTGHNPSNSNWDVIWNLQMAEISSSSSLLLSRKNNKSYGVEWRSTAPDQIIEQKCYVRKKQGQID